MTTYAWFVRGQKHAGMARYAMEAVLKADPQHALPVIATDDPAVDVPGAKMVRFDPGLPLMVANVQAQIEVLWDRLRSPIVGDSHPVWFLDTDVLVLKPMPYIPTGALAVTWRDNLGGKLKEVEDAPVASMMPYNYGVMGACPGPRTVEAFIWLRERVRAMTASLQKWYGNQIALAALCGPKPKGDDMSHETRRIPWQITSPGPTVTVAKFPGEVWNYTPAEADEDISEVGALHFKGHARGLMPHYLDRLGITPDVEAA